MDRIAQAVEDVLLGHPHPALRLGELLDIMTRDVDRSLDEDRLLRTLRTHPERFRVLAPWQRRWATAGEARPGPLRDASATQQDAWVIAIEGTPDPPDHDAPGLRLRESVRWLGRGIDDRSLVATGRWYSIAMAEREARRVIARGGSSGNGPPTGVERRAS